MGRRVEVADSRVGERPRLEAGRGKVPALPHTQAQEECHRQGERRSPAGLLRSPQAEAALHRRDQQPHSLAAAQHHRNRNQAALPFGLVLLECPQRVLEWKWTEALQPCMLGRVEELTPKDCLLLLPAFDASRAPQLPPAPGLSATPLGRLSLSERLPPPFAAGAPEYPP